MEQKKIKRLGFLQTCMDRRFVLATRALFENTTELEATDYWHESSAGGAVGMKKETIGEDFASSQGATIFGWQAHGDTCGGLPDVNNETIYTRLLTIVKEKKKKFPDATHYVIFATEKEITINLLS